jgi:hypothetical protein
MPAPRHCEAVKLVPLTRKRNPERSVCEINRGRAQLSLLDEPYK